MDRLRGGVRLLLRGGDRDEAMGPMNPFTVAAGIVWAAIFVVWFCFVSDSDADAATRTPSDATEGHE